jgi:hypothetical protein
MNKRELLIKQILIKRTESIIKIQSFIRKYQIQKKLKEYFIINKILLIRKLSLKKIINNYLNFKRFATLKKLINKVKNCYSISPSINNVSNVLIKVFYNQRNYNKFKFFNLNFCPIRKKFVFDIPKKKFIKSNKIFRFVFLINNKIFIDKHYKCILINGIIMNTINFKEIDEKINFLNKTIYKDIILKNMLNQMKLISSDSTNFDSEEDNNNNNNNNENFLLNNKNNFHLLYKKNPKNNKKKLINDLINKNNNNKIIIFNEKNSDNESSLSPKSILKTKKNKINKNNKRKVSFGKVQFSY